MFFRTYLSNDSSLKLFGTFLFEDGSRVKSCRHETHFRVETLRTHRTLSHTRFRTRTSYRQAATPCCNPLWARPHRPEKQHDTKRQRVEMLHASPPRTGWFCLAFLAISSAAASQQEHETGSMTGRPRLAVLVPTNNRNTGAEHVHTRCSWSGKVSPEVDLVLVRMPGQGDEPASDGAVVPEVPGNARRCFAGIRTLNHRIGEEDTGRRAWASSSSSFSSSPSSETSAMLFHAFLDEYLHTQLSSYDALAVLPSLPGEYGNGDAAASIDVASLYDEAFAPSALQERDISAGGFDDGSFWVKKLFGYARDEDLAEKLRGGESIEGHSQSSGGGLREVESFGVMAVIYNNSDPEFVGYVRAASERQEETGESHHFGEALSGALADPLYGKYASKFVMADLASPAGGDSGVAAATDVRKLTREEKGRSGKKKVADDEPVYTKWMTDEKWKHSEKYKTLEKWMGDEESGVAPKWMSEEKWKGDEEAGVDPKWKTNRCLADCTHTNRDGTKGRACDASCEDGVPYGTSGCSAKGGKYGLFCRRCFNDVTTALEHDTPDDRAIMCDTLAPPSIYAARNLATTMDSPVSTPHTSHRLRSSRGSKGGADGVTDSAFTVTRGSNSGGGNDARRQLSHAKRRQRGRKDKVYDDEPVYTKWMTDEKWKHSEKYKTLEKWMGDEESGVAPKWMSEEKWKGDEEAGVDPKWKTNRCLADCIHTNRDGTKGRVCDTSCENGMPYGTRGCSAKGGKYGLFCRRCFNDVTTALKHDTPDDRAIMCDTLAPPSSYSYSRLHVDDDTFGG